jgi:uncharacterized repeat protein (TIGR01451 family)
MLRAAAALTLAVAAMPLAVGTATASQHGDDHKVTLCHRTNSETNPYVVITVDVASVFKNNGHDSHDEGGVYQPGDKARGVRWGDIIPPFSYFASSHDQTESQYPGLNYGADGQAILANGCQVPGPPPPVEQPHPDGSLHGSCPEDGGDFVVNGTTNDDKGTDVQFRLNVGGSSFIAVPNDSDFEKSVDAPAGTHVTLEYRIGSGAWTSTGETVTVKDCPPTTPPVAPSGSFTTDCAIAGAAVDIGALDRGTQEGGRFELVVNGTAQRVTSNQKDIVVPNGATLVLRYVAPGGATTTLDSETAPTDCPPPGVTPASGSFTVECTVTGASVDLGALSSGSLTGGQFELVVNGTSQTVASGQQDIAVAGGATLVLRYVPASGAPTTLQSATAPAACTTPNNPQPERGLNLVKSVSPTGPSTVGATLTYTLVVTATGNADQTNVTVSDYLPGYAPGTDSGTTTYVAGSATCSGSGTCTTAYSSSNHQVTWGLGTMAAGTSRSVSFNVIIDEPTLEADGSIAAFDIVNIGVVSSAQVPATPSNEVVTPVAAVQGTKTGQPPAGSQTPTTGGGLLPHTGSASLAWTLGIAGLLLLVGGGLVSLPMVRRRS